jgi:hypothetical protein
MMKIKCGFAAVFATALCAGFAWMLASVLLVTAASSAAQKPKDSEKKLKNRPLHWSPPDVDGPLSSRITSPPCVLPQVLELAAARANDLTTNLQNFTAQETIAYEFQDHMGNLLDEGSGTFDYVVDFEPGLSGRFVKESRTPSHGGHASPVSSQDVGLPEMALMFLPRIQDDYEMKCEATTQWNGQPTWVVHFHQRKDRPNHTLSFRDKDKVYPAMLQGRAWIAADSGEVMHLETSLMERIAAMKVRSWSLSIDYAPVQFQTQNVRIWLPHTVDAYSDFDDHRAVIYHTFTDFLLFSIQTQQEIEKPKKP